MLNPSDLTLLSKKGISESQITQQLNSFEKGFPFLEIRSAASPGNGITVISDQQTNKFLGIWDQYLSGNVSILKFVPASGAASRMFKDLFEFIDGESLTPAKPAEIQFFKEIEKFAFFNALNEKCVANETKSITELLATDEHKKVVENLLLPKGLNYGALPKGLLLFHSYADTKRTPMQEHLVEGALYAANTAGEVNIHFTVSGEHRALFEAHLQESVKKFSSEFGKTYNVSFSEQKASTDTIAADAQNQPFRENGQLVFRPGGHGALIENLNDLVADIIFVKNIDNVVPDAMKNPTIIYKKMIAGMLVSLQQKTFEYLREMEAGLLPENKLIEIAAFCENELNNKPAEGQQLKGERLQKYLFDKLNRPMRVCGMVKNTGEPGGGPFLTVNNDGTVSTQILESSQIDLSKPEEKAKMMQATHFNPVDLVCAVKNFKGEKFDLLKYVDPKTGFISSKSKNGKELKALELPGLWNGAMSDWNTVFVEVPVSTFNPVKTVNDLLRTEHQ